jgi:SAM-dependent methyltransferase
MKKDYISQIYNEKRAPVTDYPRRLTRHLFQRFNLKKSDQLLEIGCGRGDFLRAFHDIGLKCSGIDLEKNSAALSPGLEIKQCDITKDRLPFGNLSFDVVYHKSFIEHLHDPAPLMEETGRVLKKGGQLIFLTPDWKSVMDIFYEDFTHRRPYTPLAIKDLLAMWDFNDIITERFYQLPILWEYPFLKIFSRMTSAFLNADQARWLTDKTGLKYFRFSVEAMILGAARK